MDKEMMTKLVDSISEQLEDREEVSVIDPDFNTWDAKRVGDRIHVVCLETRQAILIGAAWDDQDSLNEYREGL